jgi:hypothetical protein
MGAARSYNLPSPRSDEHVWICFSCGRMVRSNPVVCDQCGAAAPEADATLVALALRRDLEAEANVRALALWLRAVGLVLLGGAVAEAVARAQPPLRVATLGALAAGLLLLGYHLDRLRQEARRVAGMAALGALGLTVLVLGQATLDYDRVGAALPAALAFAQGSRAWPLLALLVGLCGWSAAAWTLFSPRTVAVCRTRYQRLIAQTPMLPTPTLRSPFFVLPLFALFAWSLRLALTLARGG